MSGNVWIPVTTAVTTAVLSGAILLLLQLLATPRMERNKTIQQELWKAKKDSFLSALELVDRYLSAAPWEGGQVPKDYAPDFDKIPTGDEVNEQLRLLLLLSNNPQIPATFLRFLNNPEGSSPEDRGRFISLLRTELFDQKAEFDPMEVPYFFPRTPEQYQAMAEAMDQTSAKRNQEAT